MRNCLTPLTYVSELQKPEQAANYFTSYTILERAQKNQEFKLEGKATKMGTLAITLPTGSSSYKSNRFMLKYRLITSLYDNEPVGLIF